MTDPMLSIDAPPLFRSYESSLYAYVRVDYIGNVCKHAVLAPHAENIGDPEA